MITPTIITLASDFIQHIFLIVLVGLVCAELIVSAHALQGSPPAKFIVIWRYVKTLRIILIIVVMAAAWFIGEYFFDSYSLAYHLFVRWPLVLCILFAFVVFMRKNRASIIPRTFSLFVILLAVFIALDITDYFINAPWLAVLLAFERVATMLAFFFSFLEYFIMNRPRDNKQQTTDH